MKRSLDKDFRVFVRHQISEVRQEMSRFHQGIYTMSLNEIVYIMFVPALEKTSDNWPPVLPENVCIVSSHNEARLFTVGLSEYTVTPDSLLAGQQELIRLAPVPPPIPDDIEISEMGVIFYVTPQEFEVFTQELSELEEQTPGVYSFVRVSSIENLEVTKFILSHIITSQYFSARDLKILRRD